MTPDKINAVAVIRRLLDNVRRRQVQLEDLWRERKTHFEQTLQLRVFEKAMHKVTIPFYMVVSFPGSLLEEPGNRIVFLCS